MTDSDYQCLQKLRIKSEMPKKRSKKNPLTKEDKKKNQKLPIDRVLKEHGIGMLKQFIFNGV